MSNRRKPLDSLVGELMNTAANLKLCEDSFKCLTASYGMNNNLRREQLIISEGHKQTTLKRLYSLIRDELEKNG